jgi:formylglycine-generating enzyme required for sulfatase activity
LEERGGLYRFIHLSFQEFLVGRYFVENVRGLDKIASELESGLCLDSWWREPILLTIGYLDLTAPVIARRLLLRLAGADEQSSKHPDRLSLDASLASAELAGSAYLECKAQSPDLAELLAKRLRILHEQGRKRKWKPVLMASAADVLDELGDTPEGLYQLIPVQCEDRLVHFSKYPVTNLQYARFLKEENFQDEKLWQGFPACDEKFAPMKKGYWDKEVQGWLEENLKDKKIIEPRYWRDPRFGLSRRSAPVVGITWYEANAYCKWLMENWQTQPEAQSLSTFNLQPSNLVFRLPTENEWVAAAGGEEADRFAWGKLQKQEDIVRYANTYESGINRTTPVWMYSDGKSPAGIMDMSGNVWEWQANFTEVKNNWLALRGGSWDVGMVGARVAGRSVSHPDFGWLDLGFRVVVVSPPI